MGQFPTLRVGLFLWTAIVLLLGSTRASSDTSIFHKISVLRFAKEEVASFQNGSLDITRLGDQEFIHAQGEVYFIPGEFIDPFSMDESAFAKFLTEKKAITAPLRLKNYPSPLDQTSETFGTFVMRIQNKQTRDLAIYMPRIFHAMEIYFADSHRSMRLARFGTLNQDPSKNRNFRDLASPAYSFEVVEDFYIFAQVSSPIWNGKNTINISSFYLGPAHYLKTQIYNMRLYSILLSGSFIIMFIFYAFIYSFRRQDLSSLYLAFYALCSFALSILYVGNFNITPQQLLDSFTIVNLFSICALQFYLLDKIAFILSQRTRKILLSSLVLVATLASIAVLTRIQPLVASFFLVSFITSNILIFVTLYIGFKRKLSGILFFLIGTILNSAFQFPVMMTYILQLNVENGYNILMANFSMALCLALVNAKEFSIAFKTAANLSLQLQREVDQQTEKLRLQKERLEEQKIELMKTHEELKDNDEQKTRFFRSISHELRTPLTLILGTLEDSEDPSRLRRSVEIASRNAKRLYRLVNQLLDFQKIALSKVKLRTERVDLLSFLEGVCRYIEDTCQKSKISFEFINRNPERGGYIVKAQFDALEKIIFNYLGNALKFTPSGGRIQIELSSHGSFARIGVRDSGCGIARDQQDKLFKLFSQIDGPQQQSKQGTGIGLALVKELALQMQGRIGVDSEEGQGAMFWLELPRLITDAESHAFVYVDPEPRRFESIRKLFDQHGLETQLHCTSSPDEAALIVKNHPVQVLMVAASFSDEIGPLMLSCASERPECWRVLMVDPHAAGGSKSMNTQGIQAIHSLPAGDDFIKEALLHYNPSLDQSQKPMLDLVYIEDEEYMARQFVEAMTRHTLIERYEVLKTFEAFQKLSLHYRVKVLICDANLAEGQRGVDILAFAAHTSPDTIRILFTGETSTETLAAGIQEGQAHYIIYKPMDFAKEFSIIENYVLQSPMEARQSTGTHMEVVNRDWQLADFTPDTSPHVQDPNSTLPASDGRPSILIVDDILDMRIILQDILHEAGYRIFHAENGQAALQFLKQGGHRVDLLITDWMMPVKNGVDLIQDLHADPLLASIPSILLTAKTDDRSRSLGLKVGASAYLGKPFDTLEVLSIVENLLDLKKREKQLAELNQFISHNVLQRFLPPDLVKDLVAGKAVFDDAAKLQSITVLFADLCNFTSSTEQLGPTKMARILNSFLIRMTDIIFEEGGTIDKFIGDAILVFFGAPTRIDPQEQIRKAHRCALRMQEGLIDLNREWLEHEKHSFNMRIGIHHGPAIVGSFGGQKRSDYTAIGQTVNLASRIESQAGPGEILVTSEVRDYLEEGQWEPAGSFRFKGVAHEVLLYRVIQQGQKSAA